MFNKLLSQTHIAIKHFACALALLFPMFSMADLVVKDGFVRNPIPGRTMTAAFMSIHNTSAEDVVLTRATLEGAETVEIHTHSHKDGVMRMRQIFELPIKAGQSVVLEPGGLHLMVFGISEFPDTPVLELCTADKNCYATTIETKSLIKQ